MEKSSLIMGSLLVFCLACSSGKKEIRAMGEDTLLNIDSMPLVQPESQDSMKVIKPDGSSNMPIVKPDTISK